MKNIITTIIIIVAGVAVWTYGITSINTYLINPVKQILLVSLG